MTTCEYGERESYGSYNEYLRSVGKKPCPDCGGTKHDLSGPVFCPKGVWRCHPCPTCKGSGKRPTVSDDALDAAVGECYRFLDPLTRERMPSEDIAEMLLAAWDAARQENQNG